jgi:hypothetical protein
MTSESQLSECSCEVFAGFKLGEHGLCSICLKPRPIEKGWPYAMKKREHAMTDSRPLKDPSLHEAIREIEEAVIELHHSMRSFGIIKLDPVTMTSFEVVTNVMKSILARCVVDNPPFTIDVVSPYLYAPKDTDK